MRYFFDNINTAEIEKICAAGDAPETCIPCPTCGGRGTVAIETTTASENAFLHICGNCGGELEIVRPGKYQCPNCE